MKRIHAGQPITEVIESTYPPQVDRHGAFTTVNYQGDGLHFTGITLIAKENRLVTAEAQSCAWGHIFFDELSKNERLDWQDSFESYLKDQVKLRRANRDRQTDSVQAN